MVVTNKKNMSEKTTLKEKLKMNLASLLIGAALVLTGLATSLVTGNNPKLGAGANPASELLNVVGTRTGTTTTGVPFASNNATTSAVFRVGQDKNNLSITVFPDVASTTAQGPNIYFGLLGSNDPLCNTASTTGGLLNPVLMGDINWYDVGDHLLNLAGSLTAETGTSTYFGMIPNQQAGQEFNFQNMNSQCYKIEVSGSGTVALIQALAK